MEKWCSSVNQSKLHNCGFERGNGFKNYCISFYVPSEPAGVRCSRSAAFGWRSELRTTQDGDTEDNGRREHSLNILKRRLELIPLLCCWEISIAAVRRSWLGVFLHWAASPLPVWNSAVLPADCVSLQSLQGHPASWNSLYFKSKFEQIQLLYKCVNKSNWIILSYRVFQWTHLHL